MRQRLAPGSIGWPSLTLETAFQGAEKTIEGSFTFFVLFPGGIHRVENPGARVGRLAQFLGPPQHRGDRITGKTPGDQTQKIRGLRNVEQEGEKEAVVGVLDGTAQMDETIATFDRMSDLDEVRVVVLAGAELCCGNDSKEAMRAFVEKRPPQFTGT